MQKADITSERFKSCLFILIDINYGKNILFTCKLVQKYIDNNNSTIIYSDNIIANKPVVL